MTHPPHIGRLGGAALAVLLLILGGCIEDRRDGPASAKLGIPAQPDCPQADAAALPGVGAALPEDGCWNRANLAKMVADPRDLIQGKPLGPATGARESLAVGAYERGQLKPLPDAGNAKPSIIIGGATPESGGGG